MKRLLVFIPLFFAACAPMPRDGAQRATVESRPVARQPSSQARTTGRPAVDSHVEKTRFADSQPDSEAGTEQQRIIDRQSRRIAELESRPAADSESRQVLELVAYSQRIAGLRADDQAHELSAATQEYARDPQPYSRLRLALLLSTPGTSFNDDARAASLLEPLAANAAGKGPLRQFAALVHVQVSERIREQKRVAQLKEQIDGLRAIDRSLIDRDQGRAP